MKSWDLFIELLQVYLGVRDSLSVIPSNEEWKEVYSYALKHTLLGVAFSGIEKLHPAQRPPKILLSKWISQVIQIEKANIRLNIKVRELVELCDKHALKSCLLKGQGVATLYPDQLRRQPGDIDLWVNGKIDNTIKVFDSFSPLTEICHHHAHCNLFADTDVEIHFIPCWMYSPVTNNRLQSFFREKENMQFNNYNEKLGANVTDVSFDLVFSAVHIYRHLFTEGIGLRQLLDYYYILSHSTKEQRNNAYRILRSLRMSSFVSALMWILSQVFCLDEKLLLTTPNAKVGKILLEEIGIAGNFGKYDPRITWRGKGIVRNFTCSVIKNFRFIKYFPSEVMWAPIWKMWHFIWRKLKGFN